MDSEALRKFKPVLQSPMWERLEDDILLPELEKTRNELETFDDPVKNNMARGKIKFLKELLKMKDHVIEMDRANASRN